jgi:integrase
MAATDTLTDKAIRAALSRARKAGTTERLPDGAGLRLDVQPTGTGWWRWRYYFGGAERMLSLGVYPDVPLALARQRRNEARSLLATGVDPSAERKAEKAERATEVQVQELIARGEPLPGTFEHAARDWLVTVHEPKTSSKHSERTRIRFEQDVFPYVGHRPLSAIEPPELLSVLRKVVDRQAIETAHRIKNACGQVFRFGIAAGLCTRNPAADLSDALPPVVSRHHAAVTSPQRASDLLRAMACYHGHPITRAALTLSALLLLRPGELRQLEWAWVDLETALVTIPSSLMKGKKAEKLNGDPHIVPLAPQAVQVFRDLHALTGCGRYCFPSLQTKDRPMSENTVNVALRRLGYSATEATAHGFRAMARTMADERLGVEPKVIEAQLAHKVSGPLGTAYNRTTFLEQRRELMAKWADYLDRLRNGADVVPLQGRTA